MLKKVLFVFSIFSLFLLISCDNLFEGNYGGKDVSFSIGEAAAESISKAVTANEEITENTNLKVSCELLRGEVALQEEVSNVALKDLYKTSFSFNDITHGNNYFISIKIYYKDILIYKALSDSINLSGDNSEPVISLQLQQNNSKIKYELNGGQFKIGQKGPEEYFINSTIKLPEPEKSNIQFEGWYEKSDFSGEKVTELGGKKFVGDVTLYAKWKEFNVTFNVDGHGTAPKNLSVGKNYVLTAQDLEFDDTNLGIHFNGWKDANNNTISANYKVTESLELTIDYTDLKPAAVSDLSATTENGAITLSWTNPNEADIENVIITCDDTSVTIDPVSVAGKAGKSSSCKVSCTNGKVYNFEVKVSDRKDSVAMESDVQTLSQRLYVLTESPKELINYTSPNTTPNPPSGGSWTYVEFGDWPQTVKADGVTVGTDVVEKNQWPCYYGSDGYYYAKVTATPYYEQGQHNDSTNPETMYKFSDSTTIESGKSYYFKLEPIKWRVLTNDYQVPDGNGGYTNSGKKLLLAEKALEKSYYFQYTQESGTRSIAGSTVYNNNYKYSEVRAFLNGYDYTNPDGSENKIHNGKGFLQKAFTTAARAKIEEIKVDNSAESTTDVGKNISQATSYFCDNTMDKVFLLSVKEVTTADYGFDAYNKYIGDGNGTTTSARIRIPTDYAKASGVKVDLADRGWWWLRSPKFDNNAYVRDIFYNGKADDLNLVGDNHGGVVPALSISF